MCIMIYNWTDQFVSFVICLFFHVICVHDFYSIRRECVILQLIVAYLSTTCSCIPCGHVYGRSCLERWLRRCGSRSAKVPCMTSDRQINFMLIRFLIKQKYDPNTHTHKSSQYFFLYACQSLQCPQCGELFKLSHITNLYASENLWDGCCQVPLLLVPHCSMEAS